MLLSGLLKKMSYIILQNLTKPNKFHSGRRQVVWAVPTGSGKFLIALGDLWEELSRPEGHRHVPGSWKLRKNLTKSNKILQNPINFLFPGGHDRVPAYKQVI